MRYWKCLNQQQPLLLLVLVLGAVTSHALRRKLPQQQLYMEVVQPEALDNTKSNSTDCVPLSLASLQQHQESRPSSSVSGPSPTSMQKASSFFQHGSWVLPTESKQTRGMFNWYTNPYTYVIVGGMMGALVGLGVWCIVASYTYKA